MRTSAIIVAVGTMLLIAWLTPVLGVRFGLSEKFLLSEEYADAVHLAIQIGRLDYISVLLGILGIIIGISAIISFDYIRNRADKIAEETAEETAGRIANEKLNYFLSQFVIDPIDGENHLSEQEHDKEDES